MIRRRDPFMTALGSLRARAEQGVHAPGSPVVIMDEARRLNLSTTPVREALVWLSGYGLVERSPTGGFLAPRLERAVVRDRFAFRLQCLERSVAGGWKAARSSGGGRDAVSRLAERKLCAVRMTGNAALVDAYRRVCSQLVQLQPAETRLFDDLEEEAVRLLQAFEQDDDAGGGLVQALTAYHLRRIEAAPLLILTAEAERGGPQDGE